MSPSRTAKSVPAGGGAVMANLPQGVMAPAPEPTGTPWDAARQLEPDAAADGGHRPAQTTRTVLIRPARSGGERDGARGRSPLVAAAPNVPERTLLAHSRSGSCPTRTACTHRVSSIARTTLGAQDRGPDDDGQERGRRRDRPRR